MGHVKKAIVILFLLIALAGTGFGFGYIPLRLEPGTQAVMFSKTSGWNERPFEAGRFAWAWELLIPTNATLYVFPGEARRVEISSSSLLPSASLYSSFLEGEPSFEDRIELQVSYRVSPEGLSDLAPAGLRPDGLDQWYADTDSRIEGLVVRILGQTVENATQSADSLTMADVSETVHDRLQDRIPEIELISVVVRELSLSDIQLYREGRETYMEVQDARREALIAAAQQLAQSQASSDQRLGNLERYGQLLSEYPILLDYLQIAAQNNSDPLDLTDIGALEAMTQ
jgi:hypothetical protein